MLRALPIPSTLFIAALFVCVMGPTASANAPQPPQPNVIDTSPFRSQLSVLSDGKGHIVTLVSFEHRQGETSLGEHLFYGDGVHFYRVPVHGRSSDSGNKRLSVSFWAPRAHKSRSGELTLNDGSYTLKCGERTTYLRPVEPSTRQETLAKASFFERRWPRRAYLLARDDEGVYYYVDRARTPPGNYDFHLYVGPRGNMKQRSLTNIVSDSEGDIFVSKRGRLKALHAKRQANRPEHLEWIKGRTRSALTKVPLGLNAQLIYRDLGVYDGKRLGTPCDDL